MNKKILKVLAVLILIFLFGHLNVHAEKKVNLGFKAGYNFSSHWSAEEKIEDSSVVIRSKFGILAGAVANFRISDFFRLQPEILYFQKGSIQDVTVPDVPIGTISVVYDLHYLEIPIILKSYLRKGKGRVQPVLSVGPFISFLLKSTYSYSNIYIGNMEYDIDNLKKTDMGFHSGLGIEFHDEKIIFGIHLRSSMGFVNLDLPTGPNAPTVALRNLSYVFNIELLY
ncbi:porin family protein [Acidobacteriota bacterium]